MKTYVQVGTGSRAQMYYKALAKEYKDNNVLMAFCDSNKKRMEYANKQICQLGYHDVPMYGIDEFEKMLEEQRPDIVIISSIDRTHHTYIKKAMEFGADVICEKPMTIDEDKCNQILECMEKTGRKLRMTFNCRYMPYTVEAKKLLMKNAVGNIKQVHFEWFLDTTHGADYFRRWHRDKKNSGGLLIHKATHHFDLVNWWIESYPEIVFSQGGLKFYGRENAEERGITKFYTRVYGSENAKGDPFALDMTKNEELKALYLDAEEEDGYIRDQSVFGDNISIEDTMCVQVKYHNGVLMSYSLNAYSPIEGFRVVFTGDNGRIELSHGIEEDTRLRVYPMFGKAYDVEIEKKEGDHGGADVELLKDLFGGENRTDELNQCASHIDAVTSIMTGICANKSMNTGLPVAVSDLLGRKVSELK